MRPLALSTLLLLLGLAVGCGKKPAAPPPAPEDRPGPAPVQADPAADRNKLLAGLKKQDSRRPSIDELSWLAENDPAVLPALVEMLRDKGTAGPGRTRADQVNSTREAAALAIMLCTKGEGVMREKGLPILREGLADPSPAIREHTAYTIGQLGVVGKPLAADVQKLCTDPDENVRGVAFDTLRLIGVADPAALAKLLAHKEPEVVRLAAELILLTPEMPDAAVAPLTEALGSDNSNIRAAAAGGLAAAGPKAAPAAAAVAEAIKKSYPAELDPKAPRFDSAEAYYWKALARIGEPAVAPAAKLLEHTNPLVRSLAARTLGEIGQPAKSATGPLKKALGDQFIEVAVEAAVALYTIGEARQEAIDLMKRAIDVPGEAVAGTAIQNIPRMGDAAKELVPLALAKMGNPNPSTRYAAVELVGQIPREEGAKAAADVARLATDDFPDLRRIVGRVLEKLGPAGAPAAESLGKALAGEKELDIRGQFVETLIAMGEGAKPALPGILPLLSDPSLDAVLRAKVAAAVVVADPSSPEVVAALVKSANDSDQTVRVAVATALGKLKPNPLPPDALNTLVKVLKTDPKMVVRDAAVQALATAGPRAKAAKSELEPITTGQLPGLALWAKVALAAIDGDVNAAAPAIRAGLTDRSSVVRAASSQALLVIGPTGADLPVLLKLLKDFNPATKTSAANAVGRLAANAKDAVPQLTRLLDDSGYEVRIAAAEALGQMGTAALPAVKKLKELSADPLARSTAQRAIDRIEKSEKK